MILRKYQELPTSKCIDFFNNKKIKPSIIVCPTAWGKSWLIAAIITKIKKENSNEKFLVLSPSVELLLQNAEKLKLSGINPFIYSASVKSKCLGDVTYATLGSIKNLGLTFKQLGFTKMIIDECHLYSRSSDGMLGKFLSSSGITHVLGLTATPLKLQTNSYNMESYSILKMLTSRSKHGNFFKEIIHVCQIQEMLELGFWSKLLYEVYDFDTGKLVFNSTKAEFTEDSIAKAYKDQNTESKIIKAINNSDRKSILVFVPTVAQAIDLALKLPNAAAVYGDMDKKERDNVTTKFKLLDLRVVVNVNVLSVGFDHPELDLIICGRSTASLSWWYQAVGRITRIHPNKENGLIIDFAGNTTRFGRIEELYFKKDGINWKLYGEEGKLLTGVPMHEIGEHTEQNDIALRLGEQVIRESGIITFGKYAGKKVEETPTHWRDWMLKEYTFNKKTMYIKDEIMRLKSII